MRMGSSRLGIVCKRPSLPLTWEANTRGWGGGGDRGEDSHRPSHPPQHTVSSASWHRHRARASAAVGASGRADAQHALQSPHNPTRTHQIATSSTIALWISPDAWHAFNLFSHVALTHVPPEGMVSWAQHEPLLESPAHWPLGQQLPPHGECNIGQHS